MSKLNLVLLLSSSFIFGMEKAPFQGSSFSMSFEELFGAFGSQSSLGSKSSDSEEFLAGRKRKDACGLGAFGRSRNSFSNLLPSAAASTEDGQKIDERDIVICVPEAASEPHHVGISLSKMIKRSQLHQEGIAKQQAWVAIGGVVYSRKSALEDEVQKTSYTKYDEYCFAESPRRSKLEEAIFHAIEDFAFSQAGEIKKGIASKDKKEEAKLEAFFYRAMFDIQNIIVKAIIDLSDQELIVAVLNRGCNIKVSRHYLPRQLTSEEHMQVVKRANDIVIGLHAEEEITLASVLTPRWQ